MPALLKIALIFAAMLLAIRWKAPIGAALLGGAALMGLFFSYPAADILGVLGRRSVEPETVSLLLIVLLILGLSEAMNVCGQLQRIVDSVSALVRGKRAALIVLPALIGLLPMPGGAVFSAPMVETVVRENGISPQRKTAINYWFRHIWEYWWPLYPGVILAVSLTGTPTWRFMAAQIWFTIVSVAAGYLFMLRTPHLDAGRGNPGGNPQVNGSPGGTIRSALGEVFPILLIVGSLLVFSAVVRFFWAGGLPRATKQAPIILAVALGYAWVAAKGRLTGTQVARSLVGKDTPKMAALVFGVMVFKGMLEDCGAVKQLTQEMQSWGIPLVGVAMFVPFIAGIVTGIAVGFVGASFPLVVGLIHAQGLSGEMVAYTALAYGFGYMGMMLSPIHLCFVLTREYFSASLRGAYRYMAGPSACMFATSAMLFVLYRLLSP